MSSLAPPAKRLWWNEPIHKSELLWITPVFVWGLVMTFMMPYWHVVGKQNLGTETYRIKPADHKYSLYKRGVEENYRF